MLQSINYSISISMEGKIIEHIRQQTKRLVDQLQQLQENKDQFTEQQYTDLKASTIQDLQTFQKYLANMQKGDQLLASEIQKSKAQIMKACRETFNMEQITNNLLSSQVKSLRSKIADIDHKFQLKQIPEGQHVKSKRGLIVELQDSGIKISEEQAGWLELHHFDLHKGEIKKEAAEKHLQIAQKDIHQLDK